MPAEGRVPPSMPSAWTGAHPRALLSQMEGGKPTPSTGHAHAAGLGISAAQVEVCGCGETGVASTWDSGGWRTPNLT